MILYLFHLFARFVFPPRNTSKTMRTVLYRILHIPKVFSQGTVILKSLLQHCEYSWTKLLPIEFDITRYYRNGILRWICKRISIQSIHLLSLQSRYASLCIKPQQLLLTNTKQNVLKFRITTSLYTLLRQQLQKVRGHKGQLITDSYLFPYHPSVLNVITILVALISLISVSDCLICIHL